MLSRSGLQGALSSVLGTAVGVGNLWVLAKLLTQIVDRRADKSRGRATVLLVLKTVVLFVLVGLLVNSGRLLNGPFVAGITACVLALPVGALLEPSGETLEGKRSDDAADRDDEG
ncbi:MAG: hypothetical protein JNK72_25535 [Myxococcales bacterium]|nr:hypothetical protein [Myxococcales bacterium]